MSSAAMKWAARQNIENGPLSRLLDALAMLANEKRGHSLFHSQETIARKMRASVRTVREHLHALEVLGVIQRARRSRGRGLGRTTDLIRLRLDKEFTFTKDQIKVLLQPAKSAACNSTGSTTYNRQVSHLQPAKSAGDQLGDQPEVRVSTQGEPQDYREAEEVGRTVALRVVNGGRS